MLGYVFFLCFSSIFFFKQKTAYEMLRSLVGSAVDPGGGGASGAAFGTGKRLHGAEQKTTADSLWWGAIERLCWVCVRAQAPMRVILSGTVCEAMSTG